jgi:hypothetical protein
MFRFVHQRRKQPLELASKMLYASVFAFYILRYSFCTWQFKKKVLYLFIMG